MANPDGGPITAVQEGLLQTAAGAVLEKHQMVQAIPAVLPAVAVVAQRALPVLTKAAVVARAGIVKPHILQLL
jgi:hypothetical protein